MSILKFVALLGILLGIILCILETRKTGKRYIGLFAALVILSTALFFIAGVAEDKFQSLAKEKSDQSKDASQELSQPSPQNTDTDADNNEFDLRDDTDKDENKDADNKAFDLRDDTDKDENKDADNKALDLKDNTDKNAAPTNADPDADKKALIESIKQDLIKEGYDPDIAQEAAEAAVK